MEVLRRWARTLRRVLPRGGALPVDLWDARHRTVLVVLWLHVVAVPVFGLVVGRPLLHCLVDAAPTALLGASASLQSASSRRVQAVLASVGLLTASAALVHLAGGATEMHFHFFVMLTLIALYQDWVTLLVAIAFVGVHHAAIAADHPHQHGLAAHPVAWVAVHAGFVLAASAAQITSWRVTEVQHDRSEEALRSSERRFRALIEHSRDGLAVVRDGVVEYDSPSVHREFGLPDRRGTRGIHGIHPDDAERLRAAVVALPPGGSTLIEHRLMGEDGVRWVESQVTDMNAVPDVEALVVNFRDVGERRELEQRLAHQAFHDALTGLANRALFADRIDHALILHERDEKAAAAVLFIDLDDFKTVNDALGHVVGDEVLVEAARRIASCIRPGDTCARLGGDEFGVLLERAGHDAYEVGTRLLEALQVDVERAEGPVSLNASIGLAFSRPGDAADDLVRNADLAMYQAKGRGKGCLEVFEDGMREAVLERLALKLDLKRALEAGEFVPYYQPVVSLTNGRMVGAEALVRWNHPERGVLLPAAFIELAEESGVIIGIGQEVLARACADAAAWPGSVGVSVNLSPRQLQHESLIDDVAAVLAATGLCPSRLTLEITEMVLVADPVAAARVLGGLKALGVSVALDDFGTGYSSLSYLNQFPVDTLKIDKSFIDAVGHGKGNEEALLQAIVGLGRTLELTVVAEGIERVEQRTSLQLLGCGLGQGYLFARPMANDRFLEYAKTVRGSNSSLV
ncbi:MAG: putative signaling protein [Actinomycetia bacterium]|nr:putative signaling protein [Actinomycetes bacterium]